MVAVRKRSILGHSDRYRQSAGVHECVPSNRYDPLGMSLDENSFSPHCGCACYGNCPAAAGLAAIAPPANRRLASHPVAASDDLVALLLHLAEISIWGFFYLWRGCLPNAETAFYFSGATYTTIGYGDVVLARPWRLLGPIEGLMGVLMCGLSTGYFFVVVSRIHQGRPHEAAEVPITEKTQP